MEFSYVKDEEEYLFMEHAKLYVIIVSILDTFPGTTQILLWMLYCEMPLLHLSTDTEWVSKKKEIMDISFQKTIDDIEIWYISFLPFFPMFFNMIKV